MLSSIRRVGELPTGEALLWLVPFGCYLGAAANAARGVATGREDPRVTVGLLASSTVFPAVVWSRAVANAVPVGVIATAAVIWWFYRPFTVDAAAENADPGGPDSTDGDLDGTGDVDETTADEVRSDPVNPYDLHETAEERVEDARAARADGEIRVAESHYDEAVRLYRTADDRFAADEYTASSERARIRTDLEAVREERAAVKGLRERRRSVAEPLRAAEESFLTAIVAHADGRYTLSKLRYRQARDRFDDALEAVDDADPAVFDAPVEVTVDPEGEFPSNRLGDVVAMSDEGVEALSSIGIETVDDLRDRDLDGIWQSSGADGRSEVGDETDAEAESGTKSFDELMTDGTIDAEAASKLAAVSRYRDEETREFTDREAIADRRDRAAAGFEASV
ncbi:hypothetical protein GCM10008992_05470 [Halorubrum aquaticum]